MEQSAVEFIVEQLAKNGVLHSSDIAKAKEMETEQRGCSKEDVTEMLFMALNEPKETCCTTHTQDSIVRKVLKTFKPQ